MALGSQITHNDEVCLPSAHMYVQFYIHTSSSAKFGSSLVHLDAHAWRNKIWFAPNRNCRSGLPEYTRQRSAQIYKMETRTGRGGEGNASLHALREPLLVLMYHIFDSLDSPNRASTLSH